MAPVVHPCQKPDGTSCPLWKNLMVPVVHSGKTWWYQLSTLEKLDGTSCPLWKNLMVPVVHPCQKLDGTSCPLWKNLMVPVVHSGKTWWYQFSTPEKLDGTSCPLRKNLMVPVVHPCQKWHGPSCPLRKNLMVPVVNLDITGWSQLSTYVKMAWYQLSMVPVVLHSFYYDNYLQL